jgi:hypothetical protein
MLAVVTLTRWRMTAFSISRLAIRPRNSAPSEVRVRAFFVAVSSAMRPSRSPASGVSQRKRHRHLGDQVALLRPAHPRPKRDGYVGSHRGVLDRLAPATEERAQAAGRGGQEDVVHRRRVGVRDVLDRIEGRADQGEFAVRTDHPVEAGFGRGLLGEEFAHGGPRRVRVPQRGPRTGKG